MLSSMLKRLANHRSAIRRRGSAQHQRRGDSPRASRLTFEALEERRLLSIDTGTLPLNWPQPENLVEMGGNLYFVADDGIHGRELWKSDTATGQTEIVKELVTGVDSSRPSDLTTFGNSLYFFSDDESYSHALWKTDGTPEGTVLVKDSSSKAITEGRDLFVAGDKLFVYRVNGPFELWVVTLTDQTPSLVMQKSGLFLIQRYSDYEYAVAANSQYLYFAAPYNGISKWLWRSDGTVNGTVPVVQTTDANYDTVKNALGWQNWIDTLTAGPARTLGKIGWRDKEVCGRIVRV